MAAPAGGWMLPACVSFLSQRLPFHFVAVSDDPAQELVADYRERQLKLFSETGEELKPPVQYKDLPYPVLSRTGLAPAPTTPDESLFRVLAKEKGGPRLVALPAGQAAAWISANLPRHPEEGLLVYSVTDLLEREAVRACLEPWGERALWLEGDGETLRASRVRQGKLATADVAKTQGQRVDLLPGWQLLVPNEAVRRRFTIEESPKEMKPGIYKFPSA